MSPSATPLEPITLSINDAVRVSGLGRTTLYSILSRGQVKAVRAGRRTLVDARSLRSYLAALPAATYRTKEAA